LELPIISEERCFLLASARQAYIERPGRRAPVQSGARELSDGLHPEGYGDTNDMDRAGRTAACGTVRGLSVRVNRRRHAGPRGGEQRPRKWREGRGRGGDVRKDIFAVIVREERRERLLRHGLFR
ncbi:unnamed protein product, partial [Ectocarpus sp. 12 AP-2014]